MKTHLIALRVDETDKADFQKEIARLFGDGKIEKLNESNFVRIAVNEKLRRLGSTLKI
jgi:hypothetical protein